MNIYQYAQTLYNTFPEHWCSAIMLGGGCLRAYYDKTTIKDIDCFFRCEGDYQAIRGAMEEDPRYVFRKGGDRYCEYTRLHDGVVINLVGFIFGKPRDHLERFDFRCCQFVGWVGEDNYLRIAHSVCAPNDAKDKLLYIQNNNGGERTLRLIRHYIEDYGYRLHPGQAVEQEDAFEDAFSEFDAHRPQGVHPSDFREAAPEWWRQARRRVAALPVQPYPYQED